MRAAEIMTREHTTIHPDALIEEVAPRLGSPEADPIPVCENERLIGMISHQDIAPHINAATRNPRRIRVRDVLTPEVVFCLEGTEVVEAAAFMKENHLRRLPVLSADRKLAGMLTLESIPSPAAEDLGKTTASGLEVG
jgi:IMP dehydrogenase